MKGTLDDIRPTEWLTLYDLIQQVGIDVSDWSNYRGKSPAANPKYCYRWAFSAPEPIILNLWHFQLAEIEGVIVSQGTMRPLAAEGSPSRRGRAKEFDKAVRLGYEGDLDVRVILMDGIHEVDDEAWRVKQRRLNDEVWHVTSYDNAIGWCTIARGTQPFPFVDQHSVSSLDTGPSERQLVTSGVYDRSRSIRNQVLRRAAGKCELCGEPGSLTTAGKIYLETHHIVSLAERGIDHESNVAALCPNDHRLAHFGVDREAIRRRLLEIAQSCQQ